MTYRGWLTETNVCGPGLCVHIGSGHVGVHGDDRAHGDTEYASHPIDCPTEPRLAGDNAIRDALPNGQTERKSHGRSADAHPCINYLAFEPQRDADAIADAMGNHGPLGHRRLDNDRRPL